MMAGGSESNMKIHRLPTNECLVSLLQQRHKRLHESEPNTVGCHLEDYPDGSKG